MKRIIKKFFPSIWRIKIRQFILYVEAYCFRLRYGRDTKCSADTLRCNSDKKSKNYQYAVLGKNIPVCCASHLVELLFWVDKILRNNGLLYHINYGTLLGAIRHHGGIIPWDTDVDICVDKNDMQRIYEVLFNQARKSFVSYQIIWENTKEFGDIIKVYFSDINTLHVDLFGYKIDDGFVKYCDSEVRTEDVFPLREIDFYGKPIYAPKTLVPLDVYYGADWNKYYYAQWGLFTQKRVLTEDKRKPADIDYRLIREY